MDTVNISNDTITKIQYENIGKDDYTKKIELNYSKVRDVKSPQFGTDGSAGFDVFIPYEFKQTLFDKNKSVKVPTGLKFNIPDGYVLIFFNKSGIASKKSLVLGACVIDSDYQGEVIVNLHNIGEEEFVVLNGGDPIAQLIMYELPKVHLNEVSVDNLYKEVTNRGEGGFGSTFKVEG